jgi:hypothetical protein
MKGLNSYDIKNSRKKWINYILSNKLDTCSFTFTRNSEISAYARCFAIFCNNLNRSLTSYDNNNDNIASAILNDLNEVRERRTNDGRCMDTDKPYLQLLTFSLSSLSILKKIDKDVLFDHINMVLCNDVEEYLKRIRAFEGSAGSGNLAMFMAILLIHARNYFNIDTQKRIDRWCELHINCMNQNGFWGPSKSMTYLQFQNGYHQYEILNYLKIENPKANVAAEGVSSFVDREGHFAPYPGGGACYDYDAVYMITSMKSKKIHPYSGILQRTAQKIISEQNKDGGFSESLQVRPRSCKNLRKTFNHIFQSKNSGMRERIRYGLTLLRPKHDRIHTHWSNYSRKWDESNLWDSWFRMLTIARIDIALNPKRISEWGFINYPGIGHHHLLVK